MSDSDPAKVRDRVIEVKAEIARKCASDTEFRAALLENPQATIEREYGLPAGTFDKATFKVVEEAPDELLIVIPASTDDVELSMDQLEAVAGGFIAPIIGALASIQGALETVAQLPGAAINSARQW